MLPCIEKSMPVSARPPSPALLAATLCALALTALPAGAQGTGGSSYGSPRAAASSANGTGATVSRDDSKMMADLAQANIAEIESGKMALDKSSSEPVKKFAQQMVDDHTAALHELQALAQSKGVKLPDGTDLAHKTLAITLKAMTGTTFDNQYMKRSGVNDHQSAAELLQNIQKNAKDAELKAMAAKMLPTVQQHLQMARQFVAVSDKK